MPDALLLRSSPRHAQARPTFRLLRSTRRAAEVAQAYDWTGFYFGVNSGGGWGHSFWSAQPAGVGLSGGQLGGTAGYNWQAGKVVLGVEGDVDWSGLQGTRTSAACPLGCTTSNSWPSKVRGRVGYAFDYFTPYVTGGLAVGNIRAATPGLTGGTSSNAGWTIGAAIGEAAKRLIHLRYGFASMQVEETLQLCLQLGGVHRR